MRKLTASMLFGLLLASAGFAAAAIGSHGKLLGVLTGTSTSSTSSTMTATTPGQRRVTICHRTHSTTHAQHTITVAQAAVAAHLRHGDKLGACVGGATTTTTTSSHGNSQSSSSGANAPGHSGDVHGNSAQSGHGSGHDDS